MKEKHLEEIIKFIKDNSFIVEKVGDRVIVRSEHDSPVTLVLYPQEDAIEIRLEVKDLVDYIEELRDHGEDVRGIVESQIDDLKSIAYKLINWLSRKGFKITNKLRESELDILEELEEE